MRERISRYVYLLFLISACQNAFAATAETQAGRISIPDINLCPTKYETTKNRVEPRAFSIENRGNTEINADFTETSTDGSTKLDGNIIIERHLLRVTADHANYSKKDDQIKFSGNVYIDTESMSLNADGGTISINNTDASKNTQGQFDNITFFIPDSNMNGKAETIHSGKQADNTNISTLINASITSCDLLDPDWLISADEIELDHDDEYGSADDVVIRFKGVPFMYTPYIEFPTSDRRRSGLLFPQFGTSSSRGLELAVPWYWNIAPNQDAVLTPRYMEKRGLELGGDYRYLTRSTTGELKGAYLHEDDITLDERYQYRYQQHSQILSNLFFDAKIQDISDADYFNDFSNSL
ncbi:MAG: LPS-assembly protein LptD, partial [Proteobacteria bacterium]|nr:LPS-assembly protein LptD [Pseudomonadota bacterium]